MTQGTEASLEVFFFLTCLLFGVGLPVGIWFGGDWGVRAVTHRRGKSGGLEAAVLE